MKDFLPSANGRKSMAREAKNFKRTCATDSADLHNSDEGSESIYERGRENTTKNNTKPKK
jgi:hypothetical protein